MNAKSSEASEALNSDIKEIFGSSTIGLYESASVSRIIPSILERRTGFGDKAVDEAKRAILAGFPKVEDER